MTRSQTSRKSVKREIVRTQTRAAQPESAVASIASEQIGRVVLEGSPHCVQLVDSEGRVLFTNATGSALLEFDDDSQWRGKLWWSLWPAAETATLREALSNASAGRSTRFQVQGPTSKGTLKSWDVLVSPVPEDESAQSRGRVLVVARDITGLRQAEEAQARLAAIVHTSVDAIVSKDLNGVITSWNGAAERIFGYSAAEAIGQSIMIILPDDRHDEERRIMERIHRGERIEAYDTRRRRKDGTLVEISVSISPVIDTSGRIIGASKIARDITDRKLVEAALQESEMRVRLATEATGVGVWQWHLPSNTVHWDAQLFSIYGMAPTPDRVVTYDTWRAAVVPEDLARIETALQGLIQRRDRNTQEFRIRRQSDGQIRHIHAVEAVRTDAQGQTEWLVGSNRDVTEWKLMQEALATADRRKDEFLAMLAHELRNPLAPIRMGLEVFKHVDPSSDAGAQTLAMMDRQLRQLVRLVDDLMDISRITNGRMELHRMPVLLGNVLHSAVESCRPLLDKMSHELSYLPSAEPLIVYADETRLAQVFVNLLNNAAKYTPPGGFIQFSVDNQDAQAMIAVRDSGIGISATALPHIFDMFTQLKGSSKLAQGGLGIGLSLVRRLVELHGGTVQASSKGENCGSEFIVRLPLWDPALEKLPS
jgi:PAS domain S-box-containing protein